MVGAAAIGINEDAFDAEKVMFGLRFVMLQSEAALDIKRMDMSTISVKSLSRFTTCLQLQVKVSALDVAAFEVLLRQFTQAVTAAGSCSRRSGFSIACSSSVLV